MKRLVGPLRYLRIWHSTKAIIDIFFPATATLLLVSLRFVFYETPGISGSEGLLSLLIPLLGALSGFYIAALTAVSAFPMESLDRPMPGDTIVILGRNSGSENPTRREFLALQFGYLSFLSLITFIICIIGTYINTPFQCIYHIELHKLAIGHGLSWLFLVIFIFLIANLISVTLFSIYYLSDRIHRYEPTLEGGPTSEPRVRDPIGE